MDILSFDIPTNTCFSVAVLNSGVGAITHTLPQVMFTYSLQNGMPGSVRNTVQTTKQRLQHCITTKITKLWLKEEVMNVFSDNEIYFVIMKTLSGIQQGMYAEMGIKASTLFGLMITKLKYSDI